MKQLTLFEMEERAAIIEFDGGKDRITAERLAGLHYRYRGPLPYLMDLFKSKEKTIHLCGENPNICLVRTFTSYESRVTIKRAWINRGEAEKALYDAGYRYRGNLHSRGVKSQIWRLDAPAKQRHKAQNS